MIFGNRWGKLWVVAAMVCGMAASHASAETVVGAYGWGLNDSGQLGNDETNNSSWPVALKGLDSGVTAVWAGYGHSLVIKNGGAWACGWNNWGQLGNEDITKN